jgi:hypothetical protein
MIQVLRASRRKVVENNHLVLIGQQPLDEVASDKAGTPTHNHFSRQEYVLFCVAGNRSTVRFKTEWSTFASNH